jgi:polyhydroxyalkanoate synthesis regulator phasin
VDKLSSTIDKLGNVVTPETLQKIMPALVNIGKLTDINQETVVKEVVSALKPKTTRKKATK